jgi:hypothetical protein
MRRNHDSGDQLPAKAYPALGQVIRWANRTGGDGKEERKAGRVLAIVTLLADADDLIRATGRQWTRHIIFGPDNAYLRDQTQLSHEQPKLRALACRVSLATVKIGPECSARCRVSDLVR